MGICLIIFLIFGVIAYLLGRVSTNTSFLSTKFLQMRRLDIVYFFSVSLILIWVIYVFWENDSQNTVQILIFTITAATLIYQGFLSKLFRDYIDKPIVHVVFDDSKSEYFHKTLMRIYTEILIRQAGSTNVVPLIDFVPAYYTRFKIFNIGNTALDKAEVIIEGVKPLKGSRLLRPFLPLNLYWSFAEDNERRKISIPPNNAYRIVDFFELMNPSAVAAYSSQLVSGNVDYERYHALRSGFRICSIPPNTLSDIFEKGSYIFTLGIYSNNAKPLYKNILVGYDGGWDNDPAIMRKKHLKVKLLD